MYKRQDVHIVDGAICVRCVTELQINDVHICTNPVERNGAWFDDVVIKGEPDEHNIVSSTVGSLLFFFPDNPSVQYGVLHPAYGYHPQHSVFTHMYRMEYEDDPQDILGSSDHLDRKNDCWVLDDDVTFPVHI